MARGRAQLLPFDPFAKQPKMSYKVRVLADVCGRGWPCALPRSCVFVGRKLGWAVKLCQAGNAKACLPGDGVRSWQQKSRYVPVAQVSRHCMPCRYM